MGEDSGVGVSVGVSLGVAVGLIVGVTVGFKALVGVGVTVSVGAGAIVGVGAAVGVGSGVCGCTFPERKRKYPSAPRIIPTTTAEIIFFRFILNVTGIIRPGIEV